MLTRLTLSASGITFRLRVIRVRRQRYRFRRCTARFSHEIANFQVCASNIHRTCNGICVPRCFKRRGKEGLQGLRKLVVLSIMRAGVFRHEDFSINEQRPVNRYMGVNGSVLFMVSLLGSILVINCPAASLRCNGYFLQLGLITNMTTKLYYFHLFKDEGMRLTRRLFRELTSYFVRRRFLVYIPITTYVRINKINSTWLIFHFWQRTSNIYHRRRSIDMRAYLSIASGSRVFRRQPCGKVLRRLTRLTFFGANAIFRYLLRRGTQANVLIFRLLVRHFRFFCVQVFFRFNKRAIRLFTHFSLLSL